MLKISKPFCIYVLEYKTIRPNNHAVQNFWYLSPMEQWYLGLTSLLVFRYNDTMTLILVRDCIDIWTK